MTNKRAPSSFNAELGKVVPKRVGIIIPKNRAYALNLRRGIVQFVQSSANWFFHTARSMTLEEYHRFKAWRPEGMIVEAEDEETIRLVRHLNVPTLDVSVSPLLHTPYYVGVDHTRIGAMAARHFLDRGLRNFAYFGYRRQYCEQQLKSFADTLAQVGGKVISLTSEDIRCKGNGWQAADRFLAQWFLRLPKPVGLLLHDDSSAMWLLQPCRQAGLRVPEDVAFLGVQDDESNCLFAYPPVSSIAVPGVRAGYEAARMLHLVMAGRKPEQNCILFPPISVTLRQSTDLIAVDDSVVAEAVRWIHDHANRPMNVTRMIGELHVSRRLLERRFKKILSRTLAEEIRRTHAERARQLMVQTALPLRVIATQSGHRDVYHLGHNFKKWFGQSPAAYRKEIRP